MQIPRKLPPIPRTRLIDPVYSGDIIDALTVQGAGTGQGLRDSSDDLIFVRSVQKCGSSHHDQHGRKGEALHCVAAG